MNGERRCNCPLSPVCNWNHGPFREVRKQKNQILYVQGETAEQIFFIQRGSVSLHKMGAQEHGLGRTVAVRTSGSFIGTEAIVAANYADSARAETALVLCVTTRAKLFEWMGPKSTPCFRVLEIALKTEQGEKLEYAIEGTATQRVASWLLNRKLHPEIPRKVMAELLGMRPETFSRVLRHLSDLGMIEMTRSSLVLVQPTQLRKLLPE